MGNKETLGGIDDNIFTDALWGMVLSAGLILLSYISPIFGAIGIPDVSLAVGETGRFLIIVFGASIFETVFFQYLMLDFFDNKLGSFKIDLPFPVAVIITSLAFALFHYVAYGANLSSASSSFLSAFIISCVWCYSRKYTSSILPTMISHMILNWYILTKLSIVIGG